MNRQRNDSTCGVCGGKPLPATDGPNGEILPRVCGACTEPPVRLMDRLLPTTPGDVPVHTNWTTLRIIAYSFLAVGVALGVAVGALIFG